MIHAKLTSRIPLIIGRSSAASAAAVLNTAADIRDEARDRSRVGPTGEMRDGWQLEVLGSHTVLVGNPVFWSIFNEYGTVGMSAQPMIHPAVESAREGFERSIAAAYR